MIVVPAAEASTAALAVAGPATVELAPLAAIQPNGMGKRKRTGAIGTVMEMTVAFS